MMSMVTILFCLISRYAIINKPIQYETGKDTLYYLVFLDLMERTTNEKDKYEIKDSNLTNENRDIAKQIKHVDNSLVIGPPISLMLGQVFR